MVSSSLTVNDAEEEFQIPGDTLSARLRREHGWSEEFTDAALEGYRQFMKLKILQEDWDADKLSPSLIIDRVWHSHILDTKSYARACNAYAGHMIHHNPDGGLNQEERSERIKITQATLIGLCGNKFDKEVWSFGQDITTSDPTSSNENKRRRVSEAELITIILQDQVGVGTYFKVRRNQKLGKVFDLYAQRRGFPRRHSLRFNLDGDRVLPNQTPLLLEMEENDVINVSLEQSGC